MMEDMEELAMKGHTIEKKAMRAQRVKREKFRKLKKLAGLDPWENEDELNVSDAEETLINFLKFLKDPMVKSAFKPADYKVLYNSMIDAARIMEKLEMQEEDILLTKV